jgi:hypothetical protein
LLISILVLSWCARRYWIEEQYLAFFCEGGGKAFACIVHRQIIEIFYTNNSVGYFALFLGGLAVFTRHALSGFLAAVLGIVALIFNNGEYAAVGLLLGVLTLARAQVEINRVQH